jgi:hypothetical protein
MKSIEDARKIRRRVFGAFEMAESADDPLERRRWLTFALVGAGPTGWSWPGRSGVAEVAMQTGLYAGRRIGHQARGQAFGKPFRCHDLGSAAYISRGRAAVSAFKLHFGGFLGWWVWLFIHIGFLTGYRNRVGAILGWWLAFTRDLRRERTFTVDDMPVAAGAYGDPGTHVGGSGDTSRGSGQPTEGVKPAVDRPSAAGPNPASPSGGEPRTAAG